jgi:hypothetical protein
MNKSIMAVATPINQQDIYSFVQNLDGSNKVYMAKLYLEYMKNNSFTAEEKAEIRRHKRREYTKKRYAENPQIRKAHQERMREYRLRKKQELEQLRTQVSH